MVYHFPPLSLLKERRCNSIGEQEVKENALRIQQTLLSFGIRVQISNISVGARFTRYEIIPEMGVRIATAATDIHIEAPISGKSAIGIVTANKEVPIVTIREVIGLRELKKHFWEQPLIFCFMRIEVPRMDDVFFSIFSFLIEKRVDKNINCH